VLFVLVGILLCPALEKPVLSFLEMLSDHIEQKKEDALASSMHGHLVAIDDYALPLLVLEIYK
jgi:hypothetical protein